MRLSEKKLLEFGFTQTTSAFGYKQFELILDKPNKHILVRSINDFIFTVFNHSNCAENDLQFIKQVELIGDFKRLYYAITDKKLKP